VTEDRRASSVMEATSSDSASQTTSDLNQQQRQEHNDRIQFSIDKTPVNSGVNSLPNANYQTSYGTSSIEHAGLHILFTHSLQQRATSSTSTNFEDASLLLELNGSGARNPGALSSIVNPINTPVSNQPVVNPVDFSFPDFFESIMVPHNGYVGATAALVPPDVGNFTQEQAFDTLDFDFSFYSSGLTRPSTAQGQHETNSDTSRSVHSDAQLRTYAYEKSPWGWNSWIPEKNHYNFKGQEEINVQAQRVNADDHLGSPGPTRIVHCGIDQAARDRMLRRVTQMARERLAVLSFPSRELLEDLLDVFFLQHNSILGPFIHTASFDCNDTLSELLLGMVASGAGHIALEPIWKMGLVLQEVVRLACGEIFESDNANTRNLQVLQAYLLWLDIGVYSGFRRKTEIALAFLQPVFTMLVWSNALNKFRYKDIRPNADDEGEVLQEKWKAWIEEESWKRLVIHVFLHDSKVSITNMKNTLLSPPQIQLPLPAAKELWFAPNAETWRNVFCRLHPPSINEIPSMLEFFSNNRLLSQVESFVDGSLCMLAACHGLSHEVWAYRQYSRMLCSWANLGRRDRWLSNQTAQRDLLDDISTMQAYCEMRPDASPELLLTLELMMMMLHVDLEDILTFSGRTGEDEARRVYPRIRTWTDEAESRIAVCHAGQVFRLARTFERTKLIEFYAVALYHAALTMWVYGMVTTNTARRSGVNSPALAPQETQRTTQPQSDPTAAPSAAATISAMSPTTRILLDANDDKAVKSFTLLGQGVPGIQNLHPSSFVPLENAKGVMETAEAVLKSNFPRSRNGLPPLVENLASLMGELSKLSGRE
jgi:hypothetical protein